MFEFTNTKTGASQRHQDKLLWTVVFPSGVTRRFKNHEEAQTECLAYGGFKIVPPLYRDE